MSNANELIERYIMLRDMKKSIEDLAKKHTKVVNDELQLIENTLLEILNTEGVDRVGGPAGTAYKTVRISTVVRERPLLRDFILEDPERIDMLEMRVSKEAARAYLDEYGEPPPGVAITQTLECNIRRS